MTRIFGGGFRNSLTEAERELSQTLERRRTLRPFTMTPDKPVLT